MVTRRFGGLPQASLRVYLYALVVALVLPMFILAALLLLQLQSQERSLIDRRITREAQIVSTNIGGRLHDMTMLLQVLASSPELKSGDLKLYHDRTQSALGSGSWFFVMLDEKGQQLLNTRLPYGSPLGSTANMAALRTALSENRVVITDGFLGQTTKKWAFNVILPASDPALPVRGALVLTQTADDLSPSITPSDLPTGWKTALVDRSGHVLAASAELKEGDPFPPELQSRLRTADGVSVLGGKGHNIMGFSHIDVSGWTAVVWGPSSSARLDTVRVWSGLMLGTAAFLLLALIAAYLVSRQLRHAITGIADMAEHVGKGEVVDPVKTSITEANLVATTLADASRRRKEAEDHERLVMRELAHRVKNLLSVVQAMAYQASRRTQSVDALASSLGSRLAGMGRSIDLLMGTDWGRVSLRELVANQIGVFGDMATAVDIQGEKVTLEGDAVQNLGLVLHELGTNAVKFGALSAPGGRVAVSWHVEAGEGGPHLHIDWVEKGGPAVTQSEREGFGTTVIETHAASAFKGKVTLAFLPTGLQWRLVAPLSRFTGEAN
jgi:two-component sensor histidine kinase